MNLTVFALKGDHWSAEMRPVPNKHRCPTLVELRLVTPAGSLVIDADRDAAEQMLAELLAQMRALPSTTTRIA